jgi:hypothetical protein
LKAHVPLPRLLPWICFALFLVLPAPTFANPWYFGLGPSNASIHSDYSAIGDKSAGGLAIVIGVEFADTWSAEMFASVGHNISTDTTQNIYYPPDSAEYGVVDFRIRKSFWPLDKKGWTPWIGAGYGIGSVSWDTFFYQVNGDGLALSGGADMKLGRSPLVVRLQVMELTYSGHDTYGYGPYRVRGELFSALLILRLR